MGRGGGSGGAAASAPPPLPDAEGLEAAFARRTRRPAIGKESADGSRPPSAVAASDGDVIDAARDVEDEDLQAVIAASLAPRRRGRGSARDPGGEAEREDVPRPPPREDVPAAVEDVPGEDEDDSKAAYDEGDGDDSDDRDGDEKDAEGASPPRPASPPSPGSVRAAARRASGAATTPDPAPPPPADRIPSGLEDDDDDALVAAVTAAEAAAAEAARRRRLEDLLGETRDERGALRAEARRQTRARTPPRRTCTARSRTF